MASEGTPIETITADATKSEDWQRTMDYALERWGHVDVMVNNLGDAIRKPLVPLPDSTSDSPITDEEWQWVMDVNLTEAFLGCRTVGPHWSHTGPHYRTSCRSFVSPRPITRSYPRHIPMHMHVLIPTTP